MYKYDSSLSGFAHNSILDYNIIYTTNKDKECHKVCRDLESNSSSTLPSYICS